MKKKIKIKFVDFWDSFNYETFYIYKILFKNYNVIVSNDPDYIIFSDHGYEHLKYSNCIKIYYTIENMIPNFNQCDYGIAFAYLDFEDRYHRFPYYLAFDNYLEEFKIAEKKHLNKDNLIIKKKFCNMVVSNGLSKKRLNFFNKLSKYKIVDSGGKILNNVGGPVKSKLEFQKQYKFSFAFENSKGNGYTTEKIIDAFAAGGIPIYYGDNEITKIFNEKSFINGNNYPNDDDLIKRIKEIDNNDELYFSYIKEPILLNSNYLKDEQDGLIKFIIHIFDQDVSTAKRCAEDNHWVIQERKHYYLSYRIVKFFKPLLRAKNNIQNIITNIKKK